MVTGKNSNQIRVEIATVSVNKAYQGRKISSPALVKFKRDFGLLLPKKNAPRGKLRFICEFGVSSRASDLDNLLKATIDTIAEKWEFNDKNIYEITATKVDVAKGKEFISFNLEEI